MSRPPLKIVLPPGPKHCGFEGDGWSSRVTMTSERRTERPERLTRRAVHMPGGVLASRSPRSAPSRATGLAQRSAVWLAGPVGLNLGATGHKM